MRALRPTLAAAVAALTTAVAAAPAAAGTPQYVKQYHASISGTQAVLTGPGGTHELTCAGRALDVGVAGAWEAQSQDCRDLIGTQERNVALMQRRGATRAVIRDLDRAGRPLEQVALTWSLDAGADRAVLRWYALPGGPWTGFGEFTCDAAGERCRMTHAQTLAGRAAARAGRRR